MFLVKKIMFEKKLEKILFAVCFQNFYLVLMYLVIYSFKALKQT